MNAARFLGKSVLVTGGAGFIGSHLVDALAEKGAQVRILDNLSNGSPANLARWLAGGGTSAVELVEGDIRDADTCRRCCDGTQVVFHLAALGSVPRSMRDPATSVAVNVCGTANVFAAARDAGVRRIVYASSSSVYGDSDRLPKREGEEGRPMSPYAASKSMNEELAEVFARCFDVEPIGLRYFNVFGPRQSPRGPYAAVIPLFFEAYSRGQAPVIHGDGEQSRDFTFVKDAVAANLLAAQSSERQGATVYNVAAGRRVTVNQLCGHIRRLAGGGPEPVHREPRPGDVRHSLADLERIRSELGYEARTSLEEGLRLTCAQFSRQQEAVG